MCLRQTSANELCVCAPELKLNGLQKKGRREETHFQNIKQLTGKLFSVVLIIILFRTVYKHTLATGTNPEGKYLPTLFISKKARRGSTKSWCTRKDATPGREGGRTESKHNGLSRHKTMSRRCSSKMESRTWTTRNS